MSSIDKMDKTGNLQPCDTAPPAPTQARATTNSLCRTNVSNRQFVSTKTIRIGNTLIPIPCFLLPYEAEFRTLTLQIGYLKAVKLLAAKYNVNIDPPLQYNPRYIYPNVNIVPVRKTIQFDKTFVLSGPAPTVIYPYVHDNWSIMFNQAQYVDVCNDDTVTFSKTYTDMKKYATYWVSRLPPLNPSKPLFSVIQGSNTQQVPHVGRFLLQGDRIIFIPVVFNLLFIFYKPYPANTPFTILFTDTVEDAKSRIQQLLVPADINCRHKFYYSRFEAFIDYFLNT